MNKFPKCYEVVLSFPSTEYEETPPPLDGIVNVTAWVHQGIERDKPLTDEQWQALITASLVTNDVLPDQGPFMIEESESSGFTWLQKLLMKLFFNDCKITQEKLLRFWTKS